MWWWIVESEPRKDPSSPSGLPCFLVWAVFWWFQGSPPPPTLIPEAWGSSFLKTFPVVMRSQGTPTSQLESDCRPPPQCVGSAHSHAQGGGGLRRPQDFDPWPLPSSREPLQQLLGHIHKPLVRRHTQLSKRAVLMPRDQLSELMEGCPRDIFPKSQVQRAQQTSCSGCLRCGRWALGQGPADRRHPGPRPWRSRWLGEKPLQNAIQPAGAKELGQLFDLSLQRGQSAAAPSLPGPSFFPSDLLVPVRTSRRGNVTRLGSPRSTVPRP